jgi:bifunctional non-homologous end joining protein LigD
MDNGFDIKQYPYFQRYEILSGLLEECKEYLVLVPAAIIEQDKRDLLHKVRSGGGEGVVFKDRNSQYHAGRPASGGSQLKYKFQHTCSCIVSGVNGTKRSVALEMGDGTPVGNCAIPANKEIPKAGEIVEIRYLYGYKNGSLYQPFYLGVRDDLDKKACVLKQLHYKQENSDEDDV